VLHREVANLLHGNMFLMHHLMTLDVLVQRQCASDAIGLEQSACDGVRYVQQD